MPDKDQYFIDGSNLLVLVSNLRVLLRITDSLLPFDIHKKSLLFST